MNISLQHCSVWLPQIVPRCKLCSEIRDGCWIARLFYSLSPQNKSNRFYHFSTNDLQTPVNELVRLVRVFSVSWEEKSAALKKLHNDYESKHKQLNIAVRRLQLLDAQVWSDNLKKINLYGALSTTKNAPKIQFCETSCHSQLYFHSSLFYKYGFLIPYMHHNLNCLLD